MSQDGEVKSSGHPLNQSKGKQIEEGSSIVLCFLYLSVANLWQESLLDELVIPPYPSPTQLSFLLPDEIAEAAQTYLYAVTLFLHIDKDTFTVASDIDSRPGQQMVKLLTSYVNQRVIETPSLSTPDFDEKMFNLIFRFISEGRELSNWIDWRFVMSTTSAWYETRHAELGVMLNRLWRRARQKMVSGFSQLRNYYIHSFDSIVLDGSNDLISTFTGLRYMVTLNNDLVDVLVDNEGEFLSALHDHYAVYRVHMAEEERLALLYLFYTILVTLAYRASESSVGQSKKGKAPVGAAETLFFQLFEKIFGEFIREGRDDVFIEDLTEETPFVEIMVEWTQDWRGAEEAVETLTEYISRVKLEDGGEENTFIQDEVLPNLHRLIVGR